MQTVRWLLLLYFLPGAYIVFAQGQDGVARARKNSIQIFFGPIHTRLIDDGYSRRLLFKGTNVRLGISYGRENDSYRFRFGAEASTGKITSKSGDLPTDFTHLRPAFEYSRKLNEISMLGREVTLLPGVSLTSSNYILNNQPVFDNVSILSLHGAYANLGCAFDLAPKQRLEITYRLPVAVYSNRVVWNGGASDITYDDGEHVLRTLMNRGSFGYFEVFRNVHVNVDYALVLTDKTYFTAGYRFAYVNVASSTPVRIYSNEISAGLKFCF